MSIHVIHHNDNDGLVSAAVVARYLQMNKIDKDVQYHRVNYNHNFEELSKSLDSSNGDIYIVDIRLPPEYMDKYAERIIWIDHHSSAIDESSQSSWLKRLKKNYCRVYMTDDEIMKIDPSRAYTKPDKDGKVKIAGCELAFVELIGFSVLPKIPSTIKYSGRYDTWHHGESEIILQHHEGLSNYISLNTKKSSNEETVLKLRDEIFINKDTFMDDIIENGGTILGARRLTHAKEAPMMVTTRTLCGGKYWAHVVNRGGIGSSYYASVLEPSVDVLLNFQYKPKTKNWTGNIFTNPKSVSKVEALDVLNYLATKINFTSHGGHVGACGFVLENIEDLLVLID